MHSNASKKTVATINDDYWRSLVGIVSGAVLGWGVVASTLLMVEN